MRCGRSALLPQVVQRALWAVLKLESEIVTNVSGFLRTEGLPLASLYDSDDLSKRRSGSAKVEAEQDSAAGPSVPHISYAAWVEGGPTVRHLQGFGPSLRGLLLGETRLQQRGKTAEANAEAAPAEAAPAEAAPAREDADAALPPQKAPPSPVPSKSQSDDSTPVPGSVSRASAASGVARSRSDSFGRAAPARGDSFGRAGSSLVGRRNTTTEFPSVDSFAMESDAVGGFPMASCYFLPNEAHCCAEHPHPVVNGTPVSGNTHPLQRNNSKRKDTDPGQSYQDVTHENYTNDLSS